MYVPQFIAQTQSLIMSLMLNKKGIKDDTARRVLQRSLKETFKGFQDSHAEIKLSKSKFAEMRPKIVLTHRHSKWIQCLCEYCANIDLKIKELNKASSANSVHCCILDRYHAANLTMCADISTIDTGDKFHNLQCIDRRGQFHKSVLACV